MEQSTQSQEVLKLGKKLVKEFADHGRSSMTTAWMSHYLAETMEKAEQATDEDEKKKLEKECSEVILELWRNRRHLPESARPMNGIKDAISMLAALKKEKKDFSIYYPFRIQERSQGWGDFIKKSREYMEKTFAVTMTLMAASDILEKEKTWLEHKELLSKEENELIEQLDLLIKGFYQKYDLTIEVVKPTGGPEGDEDVDEKMVSENPSRTELALNKLTELAEEQIQNVKALKEYILPRLKNKPDEEDCLVER